MTYTADFLGEAMQYIFDPVGTVKVAKEEGMPRGGGDPRSVMNPIVAMIDVRRAWERCEWLTKDQRKAILSVAICGTKEAASTASDIPTGSIYRHRAKGLELMALWLNTTVAQRREWNDILLEEYLTTRV